MNERINSQALQLTGALAMNGLRTRRHLDSAQQTVHNETSNLGDLIVGWVCCVGLIGFVIWQIFGGGA